jgi:hypothetical protein
MSLRIGEILVKQGLLTDGQVDAVLAAQRERGRPFGVIAEDLFGLDPEHIEAAWLMQYEHNADRVDPVAEPPTVDALRTVSRRQAWQFRVLPLRRDEQGDLVLCTNPEHLHRALRFAASCLVEPAVVHLAEAHRLTQALAANYPIAGFDTDDLADPSRTFDAAGNA